MRGPYIWWMTKLLDRPHVVPLLIFLVCVGALAAAYASEVWGGLKPCILCIYQRYAYGVAGLLGLLGLALAARPVPRRLLIVLAGLIFLVGGAIAVFHVGVEQLWWRGTAECHAPALEAGLSIEELREQLLATDFVPCDQIPWSLFGLSMAGYNVLASLFLGLASLWAAARKPMESAA